MILSNELKTAIEASKKAGRILMDLYGKVKIKYKRDGTIITKADEMSEKLIRKILTNRFPDYSIIGEEFGFEEKSSEYLWAIDPLDGTTNYSIRNPFFNVSIALLDEEKPILGVVYYPFQDELFFAEIGKGAYLNNKRIYVSGEDKFENAVLTFCHRSDPESVERMAKIFREFKMRNPKVRQIGAAALEMCYVACARVESFLMINLNIWDVAAGAIIVKEAGGRVTDFDGNEFDINSKDILASNGLLHNELLRLINL
ncbi:MAG: inositol monophosphatase [Candidatus Altiarchaeales archaeon]|nr:MAG: inositol monophosphatase [Candidatus Altiarchaeales archaeon]RLI94719.1 MAG: inositol monophosphatase [Candidatus Altiarchaeales archaeon]RLI95272.1 MAG: inositol monophosphatase [Candidatus Altiarchaeales archaeon]HDO82511.1 inositol monophosphatase [Candidatus Altiarchaeales archaeon]HEX55160.1 inositol monophosphatase [Candidatus Altiarchaeales archaeon]